MIQFDLHHIFCTYFFHDLVQPQKNPTRGTFDGNQEAVQTSKSRCGVVVLAMLLLVAISIGHP